MDPNQPQLHNQPQYQPYPQQYQQAPRQYIPHSKPWHITKIVLYSLSIAFCVIVLGLSIALVVDSEYYQSSQIIWVAPQAGAALIWDIAELITVCARSGKRGIHPGAHVALHLLLWLAFICATGLTAWILVYAYECDYYCRYYSNDDYYSSSPYFPIIQAELAFLALLM